MDYLMYYGMSENPFDKTSTTIVETVDHKEMSFRLRYLTETLGIGLFTGHSGAGKTLILRDFARHLNPNRFKVYYLPLSTVTVGDFYNQLAVALGLEPAFRKATKFKQIQERIAELYDIEHVIPMFILDEAQYLSGPIFNELVLLTNFGMDGQRKCIFVLSGLPILAQMLQRAQFEAFRQRITTNYQVIGMAYEETRRYIREKFAAVGVHDESLGEEAVKTILNSTGGSLRRLDLIVTQSLIIGAKQDKRIIDNEVIYQTNSELALI